MAFITDGKIGVNLELTTSVAQYSLGTVVTGTDGVMFEYIQASEALSQYGVVAIYAQNSARLMETSIATAAGELKATKVGVVQVSIASGFYGWAQRQGKCIFNVADDAAAGAILFTTATAGVVDDATVSGALVLGLYLTTTSSLATAMTGNAHLPLMIFLYQNPA